MPTVHLLIKGKVQGVYYRASAKEVADILGVKGWIKNTSEGFVEAIATENEDILQQFTEWCRHGPSGAVVSNVIVTKQEERQFNNFSIVR